MFRRLAYFILGALLLRGFGVSPVHAAMTSTNYQVLWDTVGVGGNDTSSSSSYILRDTFSPTGGARSTSTSYQENTGYRGGVYDPIVRFRVYGEERNSQVAATALSGSVVTVSSSATFAVGNYIAIVQNEGVSQVVAFGKIDAISGSNLTLDTLRTNGTTPTIDGTNDYVYRMLTDQSLDLGTLSPSTVSTSLIAWEVDADVSQGYSVYAMENRDLTSSGTGVTIGDVTDGTVTAGSSEYGAVSSDTSLTLSTFDTQDSALSTTLTQVASRGDNTMESRDFLILKVAVSSSLESAAYSNTLSIIFVGDY